MVMMVIQQNGSFNIIVLCTHENGGVSNVAQWVKELAPKPDDVSSVPGTKVVERINALMCPLNTDTYTLTHNIHMHTPNSGIKEENG